MPGEIRYEMWWQAGVDLLLRRGGGGRAGDVTLEHVTPPPYHLPSHRYGLVSRWRCHHMSAFSRSTSKLSIQISVVNIRAVFQLNMFNLFLLPSLGIAKMNNIHIWFTCTTDIQAFDTIRVVEPTETRVSCAVDNVASVPAHGTWQHDTTHDRRDRRDMTLPAAHCAARRLG